MSYFLIASIVIAMLAILYVWYVTRGLNSVADDAIIPLNTSEDKQLQNWYKSNIEPSIDLTINEFEIAAKYLQRVHKLEISPDLLVVGNNLQLQYYELTKDHDPIKAFLPYKYEPDKDCVFDLRSSLARPGEIAIIYDDKLRQKLRQKNNTNLDDIALIMNSGLDEIAHNYLTGMLNFRWEQINSLKDPNVVNNGGSYLYYRLPEGLPEGLPKGSGDDEGVTTILDKVAVLNSRSDELPLGRMNLLCNNYEFEALMIRWKKHFSENSIVQPDLAELMTMI